MRLAPWLVVAGLLSWGRTAAAESFEFLSYTPPAGWKLTDGAGGRFYLRDDGGEVGFISLFASRAFTGAPAAAFAEDWRARVAPAFPGAAPQPQVTALADATAAVGVQQGAMQGKSVTMMLVTVVRGGRALSVVGAASSPDRLREVQAALGSIGVGAATPPAAAATSAVELEFTAPPGYAVKRDGAGATMTSSGAGCTYGVSPPFPSSGELERDARNAFGAIFAPYKPRHAEDRYNRLARGVAADGWRWASMGGDVERGPGQVLHATALVVPTGPNRVTAVWELGDVAACREDQLPFVQLFHSLKLRGGPSDGGKALQAQMVGTWMYSADRGAMIFVLGSDGTYERVLHTSTTLGVTETTRTGLKGGRYTLRGSELTFEPSDRRQGRDVYRVRYVEYQAPMSHGKALMLLGKDATAEIEYLRRSDL